MKKDLDQEELIVKKLTGSLSGHEAEVFEELLASDDEFYEKYTSFQLVWEGAAELEVPLGEPEEERWRKLDARLGNKSKEVKKSIPLWVGRCAAVITFLLIAGAAFFIFRRSAEWEKVSTAKGEIKEIVLPDHSSLTLNSGSSVKYDPTGWKEERTVYLEGEAYFSVVKTGVPFIVYANDAKVEVLGTSFNINTGMDKVQIACTEGKVSVHSEKGDGKGEILLKGNAIELKDSELGEIYAVDISKIAIWRSAQLNFEDTPLDEVTNKLELYFDIQIETAKKIDHLTFTGKFNKPQLEESLKTICLSAGLKYEVIDEHHILIY